MFRQHVSMSKIEDLKDYLYARQHSWPKRPYYFGQTVVDDEAKKILENKDYTDQDKQLRDMLISLQTKLLEFTKRLCNEKNVSRGDRIGNNEIIKHVEELIEKIKSLLEQ